MGEAVDVPYDEIHGGKGCSHAMQTRCVNCLLEQYLPAVYSISHGLAGCAWCGVIPPVYNDDETYQIALSATRRAKEPADG